MENLKSLLSYGNSKLSKSTAIFNLGSAKNCPSDRLGLCELSGECYAKKAERMYPSVLPYRERQRAYFSEVTAQQFVSEFIEATKNKRTTVNKLRVNESGDYVTKAMIFNARQEVEIIKGLINEYKTK